MSVKSGDIEQPLSPRSMINNHILIVDDCSVAALDVKNRLLKMGYEVISLIDSSEKSLANAESSKPDLVLLDFLHEIDTSDKSTEERVKKVLDIPVLFVAAKENKLPKLSNAKFQQPGFLLKFLDDSELQNAIELAVDANRHRIDVELQKEKVFTKNNSQNTTKQHESLEKKDRAPQKGEAEAFEFLRQVPIFAKLSEDALEELVMHSKFSDVAAGEYIAFEGDNDEASFIVISGRFAMTKTASSGKELVVELLGPADFIGLMFALEKEPAQLSARAQCNSEVLWIQTSMLLTVLKKNPELYQGFAQYLAHCLHLSHSLSHGLAHNSVKVRIASLLISLVAKFSRVKKELHSSILIDITRQQIADLTGTTPETATRVTRAMHLEEIIDCSKPGVLRIINLDALIDIAQNE